VTEQLAELPVPLSVQLAAEKVPPLFVKLTVPVGVVATPGVVSVTVRSEVGGVGTGCEAGVSLTLVVSGCLGGITAVVPQLASVVASPPWLAVIVCSPVAFCVKVTEQLAELPVPLSVQLAAEKVPPLFVKLTVPVGVVATPGVVSVTV